jgi:hypothetical protein
VEKDRAGKVADRAEQGFAELLTNQHSHDGKTPLAVRNPCAEAQTSRNLHDRAFTTTPP